MSNVNFNEFLEHFGVKGMRWGVRRKRTFAGVSVGKVEKRTRTVSEEHLTAKNLKKRHVSELSNAEINKALTRLNLEKQFRESNRTKGQKLVSEVLYSSGKTVLTAVATGAMTTLAKNVLGPSLVPTKG